MTPSQHNSDLIIYSPTLKPYSIATMARFFAKTNKTQGIKYMIKDADHAQLYDPNEYALI